MEQGAELLTKEGMMRRSISTKRHKVDHSVDGSAPAQNLAKIPFGENAVTTAAVSGQPVRTNPNQSIMIFIFRLEDMAERQKGGRNQWA
jgi:hypothetical protein